MTADFDWLKQTPHRRWNPLRRDWVLVSPHRTQRPWQGEVSPAAPAAGATYDPACYLCPGNVRAGGHTNPNYRQTFVFDNDYAALLPDERNAASDDPLLRAESERGICRVVCFDPDHSLTLAGMEVPAIARVVDVWAEQYVELASHAWVHAVQIFENRGAMMGASNPHPHGQIWATEHVPDESAREFAAQQVWRAEHGECLLCAYSRREIALGDRLVCRNEYFAAVVPWWAVWPFETLVLPVAHVTSLAAMRPEVRAALADILKQVTVRYDALFGVSFPYTMGFHQAAPNTPDQDIVHFHGHFYPPLLRSASVRKFMVGFEMLGMPQRDITPESAAERLREVTLA